MKRILVINVMLLMVVLVALTFSVQRNSQIMNVSYGNQKNYSYQLAWPGMLPDSPFYKLKVLRSKIIERIIFDPVKKVEFDLLMADKTIYASKLLIDKKETDLAKDAALKGENFYSNLVQDYNKVLLQGRKMPLSLDRKITLSASRHQEIFKELEKKVNTEDEKTFQIVAKFSKINYDFIVGLRSSEK